MFHKIISNVVLNLSKPTVYLNSSQRHYNCKWTLAEDKQIRSQCPDPTTMQMINNYLKVGPSLPIFISKFILAELIMKGGGSQGGMKVNNKIIWMVKNADLEDMHTK